MLLKLHCCKSNYGMIMVGNSYRYSIKLTAFLIKQFPPVIIKFGFRIFFNPWCGHPVINIAQESNFCILFRSNIIMPYIIGTLTTAPYGCNQQLVAGCNMPQSAYCKTGNNGKSCSTGSGGFYKITPRNTGFAWIFMAFFH